jgi:hypothetical protein
MVQWYCIIQVALQRWCYIVEILCIWFSNSLESRFSGEWQSPT